MKIVCLKGGLGNQMFEYCRYRQLMEQGGETIYLFYDPRRLKSHGGALLTDGFDITLPPTPFGVKLLVNGIKLLRELHLFHRLYDDLRDDCLLIDDYSQDRRFITDAHRWLPFLPLSLSPYAQDIKQQIKAASESVAVHVRRGDYLHPSNLSHFGVCSVEYYQAAIQQIRSQHPDATLFFFSDDAEWTAKQLPFDHAVYVHPHPEDSDTADLRLMSLCHHHVMANSTFSFWGFSNDCSRWLVTSFLILISLL